MGPLGAPEFRIRATMYDGLVKGRPLAIRPSPLTNYDYWDDGVVEHFTGVQIAVHPLSLI